jgi:hypothetical protein
MGSKHYSKKLFRWVILENHYSTDGVCERCPKSEGTGIPCYSYRCPFLWWLDDNYEIMEERRIEAVLKYG